MCCQYVAPYKGRFDVGGRLLFATRIHLFRRGCRGRRGNMSREVEISYLETQFLGLLQLGRRVCSLTDVGCILSFPMAVKRLMNVVGHLASPDTNPTPMSNQEDRAAVDWTNAKIPGYDALPGFKNFPGCAWGVWGTEDQLGTVNLLTDAVVKAAASEEIKTGKSVSLNWWVVPSRGRIRVRLTS